MDATIEYIPTLTKPRMDPETYEERRLFDAQNDEILLCVTTPLTAVELKNTFYEYLH